MRDRGSGPNYTPRGLIHDQVLRPGMLAEQIDDGEEQFFRPRGREASDVVPRHELPAVAVLGLQNLTGVLTGHLGLCRLARSVVRGTVLALGA